MSDNEAKETQVAEETQNIAATESNNKGRKGRHGQCDEGRHGKRRNCHEENHDDGLFGRVVTINRVSKTHKGDHTFSFAALIVVGDGSGTMDIGCGRSREALAAIVKGQLDAKKYVFSVPRVHGTIVHPVQGYDAANTVLLHPAAPGTGIIASGSVCAVMECVGIINILTKSVGLATAVNVARIIVDALKQLEEPEKTAVRHGLTLDEVVPDALLRARATGIAEVRKTREETAAAKAAEEKDGE